MDPKSLAALGEKIYAEKYRTEFEQLYRGQFAVIDVTTGQAYRGLTAEEAITLARQQAPQGIFHMIRIGEPGAFRVSYTSRVAGGSRLPA